MIIAAAKPTTRKPTSPAPEALPAPSAVSAQTAAKLPYMKTSECAKLMSRQDAVDQRVTEGDQCVHRPEGQPTDREFPEVVEQKIHQTSE